MLYALLFSLSDIWSPFNVFRYITFRTACSAFTALALTLALAPWLIDRLQGLQVGQLIRTDGPSGHTSKAGTPTMGGLLIVASITLGTLLWIDLKNPLAWVAITGTVGFGVVGFIDDYLGVFREGETGLSVRAKLTAQIGVAGLMGVALLVLSSRSLFTTQLSFPIFKQYSPHLEIWYVPFAILVLVATTNAVNLTDGLDGLATGSVLVAAVTYTAFSYLAGHALIAQYVGIAFVGDVAEVTVFAGAIVGSCLGFLWYNCHPADIFMGDTGSLALGGAIGIIALLTKQEITLLLVGGVFLLEALSVIIQVGSFRLTGRRVFRMAPLHHHFELAGWSEPKVIVRFWIMAILFALLSLATLKLR